MQAGHTIKATNPLALQPLALLMPTGEGQTWLQSKAAVVRDLNTGHGITNCTAQVQGASSLKGCKISCMASLKEVCPQEPQEEDTCCNDTLRSAEGCTQASPPPSYRAISGISSICNFPNGPKTWPSLKKPIKHRRRLHPGFLYGRLMQENTQAPCPGVERGQCFGVIQFPSQHTRGEIRCTKEENPSVIAFS